VDATISGYPLAPHDRVQAWQNTIRMNERKFPANSGWCWVQLGWVWFFVCIGCIPKTEPFPTGNASAVGLAALFVSGVIRRPMSDLRHDYRLGLSDAW
jgi:hypothetical protein